jgi:hypothetical protein
VDRHCFEANPDPNFDADPDPDPDLEWPPPTPSFIYVGKSEFFLLLITALPIYNVLSFSSVPNGSYVFSILDSILKFSGKGLLNQLLISLELIRNTDPDQPDPDQHAL